MQILSGVPARFRSKLLDILHCALFSRFFHCNGLTFLQIERLLELQPGDVRLTLRGLPSLLDIPSESGVISVHHASLLDFLQDPQRSSIFHIDLEHRMNVACAILKALSDDNHWLDAPNDPLAWYAHLLVKCSFSHLVSVGALMEGISFLALPLFHLWASLYPLFDFSIQVFSGGTRLILILIVTYQKFYLG
jgi:hypothetical protein